mmetsp:Transcript_25332/g.64392  ORF Transcript_25332/g.64392 Transcript_25332/m.64392 type:complete len:191 (+) Transcript_25332:153-725(+)
MTGKRAAQLLRAGSDPLAPASAEDRTTPLDIAREMTAPPGSAAAVLIRAAGSWSVDTHSFFPPELRARAIELLLFSYQLASSLGLPELPSVFLEVITPLAVCRPVAEAQPRSIRVTVRSMVHAELTIVIETSAPLRVLLDAYAAKFGLDKHALSLSLDGRLVRPTDTASGLKLSRTRDEPAVLHHVRVRA